MIKESVWVVTRNDYESWVEKVFSTEEKARAWVEAQEQPGYWYYDEWTVM